MNLYSIKQMRDRIILTALSRKQHRSCVKQDVKVYKKNTPNIPPVVSIILLDWSCRESYLPLKFLLDQDVDKSLYELIWVELYDRVTEQVLTQVDTYITCRQKGLYHKHFGYNVGLLQAQGQLICVCDSDAIYPRNFVRSILNSFDYQLPTSSLKRQVLCHNQARSPITLPNTLQSSEDCKNPLWKWQPMDNEYNVGACVTFRKEDAITFGGFDEHKAFRGYLCGPYDLRWRLANAGIPIVWHDLTVHSWHFAHPHPFHPKHIKTMFKTIKEVTYPHIAQHALHAVESFSTGRILPKTENREIFELRMSNRPISIDYEKKYACFTGPFGFNKLGVHFLFLRCLMKLEQFIKVVINLMLPS